MHIYYSTQFNQLAPQPVAIHVLNEPPSVKERPILRLDIFPPSPVGIHRQFPCVCMQQAAVRRVRQYYTTQRRIDYHLPHRHMQRTNQPKDEHPLPLYVHLYVYISYLQNRAIKTRIISFFFNITKQSSFILKALFTQIFNPCENALIEPYSMSIRNKKITTINEDIGVNQKRKEENPKKRSIQHVL